MHVFRKSGSGEMENSGIVEGVRHKSIPRFVRRGADALPQCGILVLSYRVNISTVHDDTSGMIHNSRWIGLFWLTLSDISAGTLTRDIEDILTF